MVTRITNINFIDALLNPNSEEYRMLSEKIMNEVNMKSETDQCVQQKSYSTKNTTMEKSEEIK